MAGEVKPTASGVSKGGKFEATRDSAWSIERSSGREHYCEKVIEKEEWEWGGYSSIMDTYKTFFEVR
jgi:hypothetical protein